MVGGWWCTEIITSALLLLFLNQDFESRIKKFEQRGTGAELDNCVLTLLIRLKQEWNSFESSSSEMRLR